MSLTDLPNDCLLVCLARCPYASLRNGVASTCKELRDAVASSAFRKTREASGWVEWGVFATAWDEHERTCYLITKSGARRTAPRPPGQEISWLARFQNELVVIRAYPHSMRAHVYNAGQNTWREIAPLVRHRDGESDDKLAAHAAVGCIGRNLMVLGGGCGEGYDPFLRRMDVYDPAQDTWSRLPDLPFTSYMNESAEVGGKLYIYGGTFTASGQDEDKRRIFVYDSATRTWTDGPRLPYEPWGDEFVHGGLLCAFELSTRLCIMGSFSLNDGSVRYLAFVWDPTTETWVDFPVPPVMARGITQVDGHVILDGILSSDRPTELSEGNLRLFVLKEGSRDSQIIGKKVAIPMQQGGGYGVVASIQDGICEVVVQGRDGRDTEEFVTSHIDELVMWVEWDVPAEVQNLGVELGDPYSRLGFRAVTIG